jgi:adenylate cyclase
MITTGRRKKTIGVLIGTSVVAVVVTVTLILPGMFQGLENRSYDLRWRLKLGKMGEQDIEDVVMVAIDDASLSRLGRFQNWPRLYHAKVAEYCASGGAAAVAFDIFFTEPDSITPEMIRLFEDAKAGAVERRLSGVLPPATARQAIAPVIRGVLSNWGYDAEFGEAAAAAGRVYFPFYFSTGTPLDSSDYAVRSRAYPLPPAVADKFAWYRAAGDLYQVARIMPPVPPLLSGARGTGFYNIEPDLDGVSRRQAPFVSLNGRCYLSMDLQVVLDRLGITPTQVRVIPGRCLCLGDRLKVPIDNEGRFLITYFGQYKKFRYISYADVLAEEVPAAYFKDKIVIVGATAAGLMDLRSVPFSNSFPGPEIHANIIEMLLTGKFVTRPSRFVRLAILCAIGLFTVVVSLRFKPMAAGLILAGAAIAYFVTADILFGKALVWVELVRPLAVMLFTNMGILGYSYLAEERQKLWIKNMFQGYMSKELVDKIMANPELLRMGGEKKEITVFFSDIKGFSSFAEKLGSPERLIALINEYLGAMSDVVLEHGGYISKYEGDAIMAFWGAPADDPRHALNCIRCIWAMKQRLAVLNADMVKRGLSDLFTRFGINTGLVTVGNVGSEKKKSYTAMGDPVVLGSRLEGASKEYATSIILSEFTYEKVRDFCAVRELDVVRVVGKEQPVRIYELLGLSEAGVSAAQRRAVERFGKGLAHYRMRRWDEAEALFRQALEADPADGPSKTFVARCKEFTASPPPPDWDGVYAMKTK